MVCTHILTQKHKCQKSAKFLHPRVRPNPALISNCSFFHCFDHVSTGNAIYLPHTVAVVVAFFFCWAPFHAQRLIAFYYDNQLSIYAVSGILYYISGILYYLSTCINPLLYNIMSNKFRAAFKVCTTLNSNWYGLAFRRCMGIIEARRLFTEKTRRGLGNIFWGSNCTQHTETRTLTQPPTYTHYKTHRNSYQTNIRHGMFLSINFHDNCAGLNYLYGFQS